MVGHSITPTTGTNIKQSCKKLATSLKNCDERGKNVSKNENHNNLNNNPLGTLGNYVEFSATFANNDTKKSIDFQKHLWQLREQSGIILSELPEFTTKVVKTKHSSWKEEKSCRVCECGVKPIPAKEKKFVSYVEGEKGKHYFAGLQHCGLSWVCPSCGHKIQTARVEEITKTVSEYEKRGYEIYLGALTLPHYKSERLKDNIKILIQSFDRAKNHRRVKEKITQKVSFTNIDQETGEIKTITKPDFWYLRSFEITYGWNGWHPHLHPIFIYPKSGGFAKNHLEAFKAQWMEELRKNDKDSEFLENRSVDFQLWDGDNKKLAEYLDKIILKEGIDQEKQNEIFNIKSNQAKRNLSNEITRGQNKKSRNGVTPWQILEAVKNKTSLPDNIPGNPRELFKEYAVATKGKSMLQACQHFYSFVNVETKEDAEILQDDQNDKVIFSIEKPLWEKLAKKRLIFGIKESFEIGQISGYGLLQIEKYLTGNGIKFVRDINVFWDG